MAKIEQEMWEFDNEADLIEKLHQDTLNQDHPINRCAARGLKQVMPIYVRWLHDEGDRGTDPSLVMQAQSGIVMSLIGTAISQHSQPEYFNEVLAWLGAMIDRHLQQVLKGEVHDV